MDNLVETAEGVSTNQVSEKYWKRFKIIFWILFSAKLIQILLSYDGFDSLMKEALTQDEAWGLVISTMFVSGIISLLMALNIGIHSYLLSKKKRYVLFGFLGLGWQLIIGIFLAYYAVRWVYCKSIGKNFSLMDKIITGALIIWALLFTI